jgi:outer membrane protein TolC
MIPAPRATRATRAAGPAAAAIFGALSGLVSILGMGAAPAAADGGRGLSLAEAVRTALANDAELYIAREDMLVAGEAISLARAAFGRKLFGELYAARTAQPPSATSFRAVDRTAAATVGISGRAETGATYTLSGGLVRQDRDDPFSTYYDGATTAAVRAEAVQPLWRGAFAAARRPIAVASLRRDVQAHELRARVERTVGAVAVAYWDLVRARGERDARASAVALAGEQVADARRLLRLGTGSDLDVVEAQAGLSRREQELLAAEQEAIAADGRLFAALGIRLTDPGWDAARALEPTDTPELAAGARAGAPGRRARRPRTGRRRGGRARGHR